MKKRRTFDIEMTITTDYDELKLREVLARLIGQVTFEYDDFESFVFEIDDVTEVEEDEDDEIDAPDGFVFPMP
jgi:hypothetical protein